MTEGRRHIHFLFFSTLSNLRSDLLNRVKCCSFRGCLNFYLWRCVEVYMNLSVYITSCFGLNLLHKVKSFFFFFFLYMCFSLWSWISPDSPQIWYCSLKQRTNMYLHFFPLYFCPHLHLLVWFLMQVKRTLFSMLIGSVFSTGAMRKVIQFVRFAIR